MSKLSLSRAWEEATAVLARDGRLFAAVALALVVLPQAVVGLLAPSSPSESAALTSALLGFLIIIGLIAQISLNCLAIGPSKTVGEAIMRGVIRMPALVGAFILLMLLLFLILIPLVLIFAAIGAIKM